MSLTNSISFKRYLSATECGELISVFPYDKGAYCHRRRNHRGDHMEHPDRVETRAGYVKVHNETQCASEDACVIHNPSAHKMRTWPMSFRFDKGALVERQCVHGVGHPDPDSVMFFVRSRGDHMRHLWSHGCDGCCQ